MAIEIAIYLTKALYDNCGYEPRTWAQKYIDQSVNETTYSTSYLEPQVHPDPPYEIAYNHNKTPFRDDPNQDGEYTYFDNTAHWLEEWVTSRSGAPEAKDLNILLTNYDGQLGIGYELSSGVSYSSSEGGLHFPKFDSVLERGDGSVESDSMQTFLHETAHQIADPPAGGSEEHNMGMIYWASDGHNYETPLGAQEDRWNSNECGDSFSESSGAPHRWDLRFSACTKHNLKSN